MVKSIYRQVRLGYLFMLVVIVSYTLAVLLGESEVATALLGMILPIAAFYLGHALGRVEPILRRDLDH